MSTDEELWNRSVSLAGLATGPLLAWIIGSLLDEEKGGCQLRYSFVRFPDRVAREAALQSDWICAQAINGVSASTYLWLGIAIAAIGFLVVLVIVSVRNSNVQKRRGAAQEPA